MEKPPTLGGFSLALSCFTDRWFELKINDLVLLLGCAVAEGRQRVGAAAAAPALRWRISLANQ
ncbi:hypothetical protein [Chitinimonas naiadis]